MAHRIWLFGGWLIGFQCLAGTQDLKQKNREDKIEGRVKECKFAKKRPSKL